MRCKFEFVAITPEAIWISDTNEPGATSVTNDAESVVAWLANRYGHGPNLTHRLYYRDSEGRWDEITHDGERFKGFKFGAPPPPAEPSATRTCPACNGTGTVIENASPIFASVHEILNIAQAHADQMMTSIKEQGVFTDPEALASMRAFVEASAVRVCLQKITGKLKG